MLAFMLAGVITCNYNGNMGHYLILLLGLVKEKMGYMGIDLSKKNVYSVTTNFISATRYVISDVISFSAFPGIN